MTKLSLKIQIKLKDLTYGGKLESVYCNCGQWSFLRTNNQIIYLRLSSQQSVEVNKLKFKVYKYILLFHSSDAHSLISGFFVSGDT